MNLKLTKRAEPPIEAVDRLLAGEQARGVRPPEAAVYADTFEELDSSGSHAVIDRPRSNIRGVSGRCSG